MYAQAVKEWSENFKILRRDLFAIIWIAGQYDRKNQSTDAVGGYLLMKRLGVLPHPIEGDKRAPS
ncbi:hypothetical protein WK90_37080 [Burkholderia cepacia]|nr:hypothetical protein WJ46_27185 [Burkholderia cepacia]KVQ21024.1 hypothetical protein WK02_35355 [Burkholderia cepacia]KVS73423.1 hypothetical protein WK41_09965 [Burkholderia cepacia]KVV54286.1 hypothetical protein WK83_01310 [Burkholderia cepacia]KVV67150.1 hypothetical protein WK85_22960 [Burkholderia cepacia]